MSNAVAPPLVLGRARGACARSVLVALGLAVVTACTGSDERPISRSAEELLRPLGDAPPPGFLKARNLQRGGDDEFGRRLWFTPLRKDYGFLVVDLGVAPSDRSYRKSDGCGWRGFDPPERSEVLAAPTLGDASDACLHTFPYWRVFTYRLLTRNAYVAAQTAVSSRIDDAIALELVVSVMRRELEIIDRKAPRR